jgi:tetratricopeptide (TPR) repeat protein
MQQTRIRPKDILMRYTPAALALALLAAVTSSVSLSAPRDDLDAQTLALLSQARADLKAGRASEAIGGIEAALVRRPGSVTVLLRLAEATRANGMQGKALHYYRKVLERDPRNIVAIAGEGRALAEKGAVEKAQRNLARLTEMCGRKCGPTREVAAAIARGPAQRVVTAQAVSPDLEVTEN